MNTANDLLELQQIDLDILRNRKLLDNLPEASNLQLIRNQQKELARKTTKITGLLKDQYIESDENDQKKSALTTKAQEINNANATLSDYRLIQSNNAELDRIAKRVEKIDFLQKSVDAEILRLEELRDKSNQIKESLDAREAVLLNELKERVESLKTEVANLAARREALVEQLPPDLYEQYRISCKQHAHIGVGKLEGRSCSGCGVELQQSQLDILRRGEDISRCPVCKRLLVVRK
ncbi:MAG: hypothetical protein IKE43_06385 [Coriobacteriales bacterium]|nr:hypothetical protein [Coriobacteriales bacterium]